MFVFARLVDIVCLCEDCGGKFQARSVMFVENVPLIYIPQFNHWIAAVKGCYYSAGRGSFGIGDGSFTLKFPVAGGEMYAPEECMATSISKEIMSEALHSAMVN